MGEWDKYARETRESGRLPQNSNEHQYMLVTSDNLRPENFREMLNKHMLLGNISNDQLMRLYQNDINLLTFLFDMGQKNKALKNIFEVLYASWVMEVRFTMVKGGKEREFHNLPSMPRGSPGFGAQFSQGMPMDEEKLQKLLKDV